MTDRFQQLRRHLSKDMAGLEIGGFFNPIAPKRNGWNTLLIDADTKERLLERAHATPGIPPEMIEQIEDVDFVLGPDGNIVDFCRAQRPEGFDFLVASHVLEHIPDLIGFFGQLDRVMAPGAVLSFAVPDLRYCFDFFRPHTTTGHLLLAHRLRRKRHLPETLFDCIALEATKNGAGAWVREPFSIPRANNDIQAAYERYLAAVETEGVVETPYTDAHCWFFTPAFFELAMLDLGQLGYLAFAVEGVEENAGSEFIVHMRRSVVRHDPAFVREKRNALLRRGMRELMDRYPW